MPLQPISAAEFLSRIWPVKLLTNETLEMRLINRASGQVARRFFSSIGEFLSSAAKHKELDIFFGVATRFGNGGKKRNCFRVRCLWMDWDNKRLSDCKALTPRPDYVVDSGGGLHLYWVLDRVAHLRNEKWVEVEARNRTLCKRFEGDIAAIDASRILRVPGFYNHKYSPPRIVKVYAYHVE